MISSGRGLKTGSSAATVLSFRLKAGKSFGANAIADHYLKHFARVELRIKKHAMGHQVAAIGTFLEITMHPDANAGSAEIGDGRRETGEEFQIDGRIDPKETHAQEHPECPEQHRRDRRRRDGQHIASRNQIEDVDDEPVFLESRKVNVFMSNHFDRSPNRVIGQHG